MLYDREFGTSDIYSRWYAAQRVLRGSDIRIAHFDTGLAPHRALGWAQGDPPDNILMAEGANLFDPERDETARAPVDRPFSSGYPRFEYPDHGVKTLSLILGAETERLQGAAPGAKIVPYRLANGPVFFDGTRIAAIGAALRHVLAAPHRAAVVSISMGNPDSLGLLDFFRAPLLGGDIGLDGATLRAIDAAYEAGIVMVCAGGQYIDRVVQPARLRRTIGVGGVSRAGGPPLGRRHYPAQGYAQRDFIDIWAQAENINRAEIRRGRTDRYADDFEHESAISGTSYAAPQVAAAAALWLAYHARALRDDYPAHEPWRRVEAVRAALKDSARRVRVSSTGQGEFDIDLLDTEAMLRRSPPHPDSLRQASAAA